MKVGEKVSWESQSQGSLTLKVGEIVSIVPAFSWPNKKKFPSLYSGAGPGGGRNHESYIVQVDTKIYWPRVSQLKVAEQALKENQ